MVDNYFLWCEYYDILLYYLCVCVRACELQLCDKLSFTEKRISVIKTHLFSNVCHYSIIRC